MVPVIGRRLGDAVDVNDVGNRVRARAVILRHHEGIAPTAVPVVRVPVIRVGLHVMPRACVGVVELPDVDTPGSLLLR